MIMLTVTVSRLLVGLFFWSPYHPEISVRAFEVNNDKWSPEAIFRAKAIIPLKTPVQLDFVDIGLLPALKGMIHDKLDRLLKGTLHQAISTYKNNTSGKKPDETLLFRLVFPFPCCKGFQG